jgi:hypothetical protein
MDIIKKAFAKKVWGDVINTDTYVWFFSAGPQGEALKARKEDVRYSSTHSPAGDTLQNFY